MRAREIISEKLVPSKWVPVKATPAIVPTSQLDKALPVYNPQAPAPQPLTGDVMGGVAQSLGQIAQMDAAQIGIEQQELQKLDTMAPPPQQLAQGGQPAMAEAMMPVSNFAGSKKNKLGPAGQAKGSQKGPVRSGQMVGGAAESRINEDGDGWFSTVKNAVQDLAQQGVEAGMENETIRPYLGWILKNAMAPAPDGLKWAGDTWGEVALNAGNVGLTVLSLIPAVRVGMGIAKGIQVGAELAPMAVQAAKDIGKAGAWSTGRHVVGQQALQGAEHGAEKELGLPRGSIDKVVQANKSNNQSGRTGSSSTSMPSMGSYVQPTQTQKQDDQNTQKKKKLAKGDKVAVPIDGKTYMLPIVDVQDNSYTVDTSSVTGSSSGTKTMSVPA